MIGYLYEVNPSYDLLEKILSDYYNDIKYSVNVNIIIDFKQLIRKIFREPNNFEDEELDSGLVVEEISSSILNIIGHYRNFFYKQNKYTTFYILYSKSKCKNFERLNSNFKKDYYEKYTNIDNRKCRFVNKITSIVEIICKYIPHCMFIDTSDYDENSYVNQLIEKNPKNELNLLISDDFCLYQHLNENSIALNMKGINTKVITAENAVSDFIKDPKINFSNKLIPLLLSLSGYEKYSISGINNVKYKKAAKFIKELIFDSYLEDVYYVDFPLEDKHLEKFNLSENKLQEIKNNFYILNIDQVTSISSAKIISKFIEIPKLISISEINRINNRFFSSYGLNLDMIWKGEKIL